MNPFGELDHRLSVVKRWGILHTHQNQSVAEHVHNVVRIVTRIGPAWFGLSKEELLTAILWAHYHDDTESLTGDLPSMVKPYFDEYKFEREHEDLLPPALQQLPPEHIAKIVKLADLMEGMHFLAIETALGNKFVSNHYKYEFLRIAQYAEQTFMQDTAKKVFDWLDDLKENWPRSRRYSRRGR